MNSVKQWTDGLPAFNEVDANEPLLVITYSSEQRGKVFATFPEVASPGRPEDYGNQTVGAGRSPRRCTQ